MKNKAILVSFVALFAMAFALTMVAATEIDPFVVFDEIEINDISILHHGNGAAIAGDVDETIPVVVEFTALRDASDVRVEVSLDGGGLREDVSERSNRFHVVAGSTYVKRFVLELPDTSELDKFDLDEERDDSKTKSLLFEVEVTAEDERTVRDYFDIFFEIQRLQHDLEILSVDMNDLVTVGNRLSLDVVVENVGEERQDNVYVEASIPGLGISRRVYLGDLAARGDRFDDDINDAKEKRVYLTIPRTATPGNYEVEVEAYNLDASDEVSARVAVRGTDETSRPPITSKTIAPGEETTFNVVLVNPTDELVVFTILPQESRGFIVEATEPIVSVGADSSRPTSIRVRATDSVDEGTYLLTVNANSDSGLSEQISFTVNVESDTETVTGGVIGARPQGVVVLTVILVIIFVVLLIVLIVLLTKRPEETEEFGETNYY